MSTLVPKYDQGSTGAVNRAFNLKLAETISVKDFGAVGDGITSDTTAFTNAIAALPAGGGTIYIPAGQYAIQLTITKANIIFQGDGPDATILVNNTSTADDYCLNFDLPALGSSVAPYSASVRDLAITGSITNNYHALRVSNCSQGYFKNIYIVDAGNALLLNGCYNSSFENFFVKTFSKGIVSSVSAANNNTFNTWYFFGGNASNNAQPIYDNSGLLSECLFLDVIFEGSLQQSYSVLNGGGNTFVGCRWESCTPITDEAYIKVGGGGNKFVNPLFTCGVETEVLTGGFFMEISGHSNEVDSMIETGVAKRLVYLTSASSNNLVKLNTYKTQNQVTGIYYQDFGTYNTISFDNNDFVFNNTTTWSYNTVANYFPQSTDMSTITTDGLTQALLGGSLGRTGPFAEGLIQTFTAPTGNRRWYVDVLPLYTSAPATIQNLFVFSFWAKSLSASSETITVFSGKNVGDSPVSVLIPNDKFVRVMVGINTSNSSTYSNLYVGVQVPVSSTGINIYGCQVTDCGTRGATFPAAFAGGYVPTAAASRSEVAPNYALNRSHKISPANAAASIGTYIKNFNSAVGQPKGWYCTTAGSVGVWTSEGNL